MSKARSRAGNKSGRRAPAQGKAYADFMAQAYAMEIDAAERYAEFADQMEVHNNPEVAQLFRKLAQIEGLHAKQILQEMGWTEMPRPVYAMQWADDEPPETAPHDALHYRMLPWHALAIALENERRAETYLEGIARATRTPAPVRRLAREMAAEEREHIRLIEDWMKRVPRPGPDWSRDPDPPVYSD